MKNIIPTDNDEMAILDLDLEAHTHPPKKRAATQETSGSVSGVAGVPNEPK